MFTSGGVRENGDRYAPAFIGNGTGAPAGNANPNYDPGGYDYLRRAARRVRARSACSTRCSAPPATTATAARTAPATTGRGTPERASRRGPSRSPTACTTRTARRPTPATTGRRSATLTYDPGSATLGDFSGDFGTPTNQGDANAQDCSTNPAHNTVGAAWRAALGVRDLPPQRRHDARHRQPERRRREPVLDLGLVGRRRPGLRRRPDGGLHQPGRWPAGVLLRPDRTGPRRQDDGHRAVRSGRGLAATASCASRARTATPTTTRRSTGARTTAARAPTSPRSRPRSTAPPSSTTGSSRSTVDLPPTYGIVGLNPPGDATTEQGWWRVEYNVTGGNDTTTWGVSIRGNPVHLVLP